MNLKKISFNSIFVILCSLIFFSLSAAAGEWYGFENGTSPKDQEVNLSRNCSGGNFTRVFVPIKSEVGSSPARFTDLCNSIGKKCLSVCDWEGHIRSSCNEITQWIYDYLGEFKEKPYKYPIRDASAIALCN